jgi:hypothetical protein
MSRTARLGNPSVGNKGCLSLLLLAFAAVGVLFTYFFLASVFEAIRAATWARVSGEILTSQGKVDQAASAYDTPFVYRMRYRYRYEGQLHSSSTLCSAKCGRAERKSLIARECLVCCIRRRTFCSVTSWRSVCRFLLICWWVWRYDRNDSLGFPCSSAPKPAALAPTC